MNVLESVSQYKDRISAELSNTLTVTDLGEISKKTGKVRDQYDLGKNLAYNMIIYYVFCFFKPPGTCKI